MSSVKRTCRMLLGNVQLKVDLARHSVGDAHLNENSISYLRREQSKCIIRWDGHIREDQTTWHPTVSTHLLSSTAIAWGVNGQLT